MEKGKRSTLEASSLEYHEKPKPGKISMAPTKQMMSQLDLALAYSPGVAAPCLKIHENPSDVFKYTSRGNLVAVISNGTAVLGLGNIGPLAAKPVMEGKAVLFKKFAGLDSFDIEVAETDPERLVDVIAAIAPSFGAINLEDIRSPDCFYVERKLKERLDIPVFHDDQHGTAVVVAAALINALKLVDKDIGQVRLVCSGAGAAALACLDLLMDMGMPKENMTVLDMAGVLTKERFPEEITEEKARFARDIPCTTLAEVIVGADIFLGLSVANVLSKDMLMSMVERPIIFALANPNPEIDPQLVYAHRPEAILATGRTDYPNQVNNVLCFPFIFRGALDCGATEINRAMQIAAVMAIAEVTRMEQDEMVSSAYDIDSLSFGPEYILPKPFDPRLITNVAPAVVRAAMESGVATRPIKDLDEYVAGLQQFVYRSGALMRPLFSVARSVEMEKKRIVFAEGEEERVLSAIQIILDQKIARPILVGRPSVIESRIQRKGLRFTLGRDVEVINPEYDYRYSDYVSSYYELVKRRGLTKESAKLEMRTNTTVIAATAVYKGDADGMLCGCVSNPSAHLPYIDIILGRHRSASVYAAMNGLILSDRFLFLVDTHINPSPTAHQLAEITLLAIDEMRCLGIEPHVALLSHSNFGSSDDPSAQKMREAFHLLKANPATKGVEIEGEMHGDIALSASLRSRFIEDSFLTNDANLLVLPNLDAANIAYNLLKMTAGDGVAVGPILLGCDHAVHILTPSASVRRIINLTALVVVDAMKRSMKGA